MQFIEELPMAEVIDPCVGSMGNWSSYLGLPTPQCTQVFRTRSVISWTHTRPSKALVRRQVIDAYERHVLAIQKAFDNGAGFEGVVQPEGSEETVPFRIMYGLKRVHAMLPDSVHWHPALLALRGRALKLVGPMIGYDLKSAVYEWVSEVALGFHEDGRDYTLEPLVDRWRQAMKAGRFDV